MAQHRDVQVPVWQGCQMKAAKQALAERRHRLREAAKASAGESTAQVGVNGST